MSKKFQRPLEVYEGDSNLLYRDKYQVDAVAEPPVPISSEKIDGDFNYLIDAVNEINAAAGSYNSIAERLDKALNADGTLKSSIETTLEEWVSLLPEEIEYVAANRFKIQGDKTNLLTIGRVLKSALLTLERTAVIIESLYNSSSDKTEILLSADICLNDIEVKYLYSSYTPSAVPICSDRLYAYTETTEASVDFKNDTAAAKVALNGNSLSVVFNMGDLLNPNWQSALEITDTGLDGAGIKDASIDAQKLASGVLGTVASKNTGVQAGEVPLLQAGGVLDTAVLPTMGAPVGSVGLFVTESSVPSNYLILNGAVFDETLYPELYQLLGDSNQLPDWRGYFVRMSDMGRGVDTGRVTGSFQEDAFKSHNHEVYAYANGSGFSNISSYGSNGTAGAVVKDTEAVDDAETRPKNVAVVYAIRAE